MRLFIGDNESVPLKDMLLHDGVWHRFYLYAGADLYNISGETIDAFYYIEIDMGEVV